MTRDARDAGWEAGRTADPGVVARTPVRESAAHADRVWWQEWRVRRVSPADWAAFAAAGAVSHLRAAEAVVIEKRRVDATAAGVVLPPDPGWGHWRLWAAGDTPERVVAETMGDTAFGKAESLSPVHALAVAHFTALWAATAALDAADKAAGAAAAAVAEFKLAENRKFARAVAGADAAKAAKVTARTLKRVTPQLDELRADYAAADRAREAARAAVAAATARTPRPADYPDVAARWPAAA